MKDRQKKSRKGATKQSTLRRELLFASTTDGARSRTNPSLPTERSKELRTDKQKAELLAWVRPYSPPPFPFFPFAVLTSP